MIIKGKSRTGGAALGDYLLSEGRYAKNAHENERVEVWQAVGLAEGLTLQKILGSYELSAEQSRCQKPLYHVQLRTDEGEPLTREQWLAAVEKLEERLGLTGYDRVIVAHTKDEQAHVHVAWNRIDYQTGLAAELNHDARKRLDVARELERDFGLRELRRAGQGRLSQKEETFAIRHGKDPQLLKDIMQTCWRHAENGQEFTAHLDAYGMTLVKGDRRDFLIVDREGDYYAVTRVTGSRAKEVREKLSDLDREQLPSLQQAQAAAKEWQKGELLKLQAVDRNRLEMKQWRELASLDERLTQKEEMRGRLQQGQQEDRDQRQQRKEARLAATLYDRGDLATMQRDAMKEIRERWATRIREGRQPQGQERNAAAFQKYIHSAFTRVEAQQQRQTERLTVEQYFARRKAGVTDPERDRQAKRILLFKQFDKAQTAATANAAQKEQERSEHQRREQERTARERAEHDREWARQGKPVEGGEKEQTDRRQREKEALLKRMREGAADYERRQERGGGRTRER
ncbi:MAG: relaxase/mobilization nuclease domain-containing protein [Acidobacteria bacterium]|nr:relaxase/mobilization nuclease domain-containing protein [Acidobacteriota bacterium]